MAWPAAERACPSHLLHHWAGAAAARAFAVAANSAALSKMHHVRVPCASRFLSSPAILAITARDAMPDGGKLTIETCNTHLDRAYAKLHPGVNPGQYICICVTDTGTGMPPDVIARAFDPFFTTKPIGQGTGLGLSMIYGFARQSEGHAKIYGFARQSEGYARIYGFARQSEG